MRNTLTPCLSAAMAALMDRDPQLWKRRPMTAAMLEYAAADVTHLLQLADHLERTVRASSLEAVRRLSCVHSEWFLDPTDRQLAESPSSYRFLQRLTTLINMQRSFKGIDTYRAYFSKLQCLTLLSAIQELLAPLSTPQVRDSMELANSLLMIISALLSLCTFSQPEAPDALEECVEAHERHGSKTMVSCVQLGYQVASRCRTCNVL